MINECQNGYIDERANEPSYRKTIECLNDCKTLYKVISPLTHSTKSNRERHFANTCNTKGQWYHLR